MTISKYICTITYLNTQNTYKHAQYTCVDYLYVIIRFAVVFGINSASNVRLSRKIDNSARCIAKYYYGVLQ